MHTGLSDILNVTSDMHTGLSAILNCNNQSSVLLVAIMYMYTKLRTQWHVRCCHR